MPKGSTNGSSAGGITARISINMPQIKSKVRKATDKKVVKIMTIALNEVKPLTPKDTGRARRGWHLEGRGQKTKLVNNVPYIGYLEKGHSKQAPNGMIVPLKRKLKGIK